MTSKKCGYAWDSTKAKPAASVIPDAFAVSMALSIKYGWSINWLRIYNKHPDTKPILAAIAGTRLVK